MIVSGGDLVVVLEGNEKLKFLFLRGDLTLILRV